MKPFTAKIGTVFESSHVPLHIWLQVLHLMVSSKKDISTHQIHRTMGVTLKTAWSMTMRIREAMKSLGIEPLGGAVMTVEGDETYIGRKSTTRAFKPPSAKKPVVALVERGGRVRSFHVPNVTASNVRPIVVSHIHSDTRFQNNSSPLYAKLGGRFAYHGVVNHTAKEYVRGENYTNTIEGFFSVVTRDIYGVYHHVSEAHLHRYLAEFGFRYSNRTSIGIEDTARSDLALEGAKGKRLTYRRISGRRPTEAWA